MLIFLTLFPPRTNFVSFRKEQSFFDHHQTNANHFHLFQLNPIFLRKPSFIKCRIKHTHSQSLSTELFGTIEFNCCRIHHYTYYNTAKLIAQLQASSITKGGYKCIVLLPSQNSVRSSMQMLMIREYLELLVVVSIVSLFCYFILFFYFSFLCFSCRSCWCVRCAHSADHCDICCIPNWCLRKETQKKATPTLHEIQRKKEITSKHKNTVASD